MAPFQATHGTLLGFLQVCRFGGFLPWLVSGLFLLVDLLVLISWLFHYSWIALQLDIGTLLRSRRVSNPRPVLDSSAQTTQGKILVFFVKSEIGLI